MTTVVDALKRIARQCSLKSPSSWVNATSDTHLEIRDDFLIETIDDIRDRVDLPGPIGKTATLTGNDGTTQSDGSERISLPSNFYRLQRDPLAVYDVLQDRPCMPISQDGTWEQVTDIGTAGIVKYYRVTGYEGNYSMDFYLDPTATETFRVSYVSDIWMQSSGGTEGNSLTAEDDILLLPRRVVETGTVARYRERRGLPYDDKYMEYESLLSRLSNDSRNQRSINFTDGGERVRWTDLVPSFIPSS